MSCQSDQAPKNAPTVRGKMADNPLTPQERERLAVNEVTIGQGVKAFIAVGLALIEIREDKLYRENYKTFEDYCQKRWKMTRQRGYQLIEAAEVAEEMSTNGLQIDNERQARALAMVPQHLRAEVMESVRESGLEPTEQNVTKATNALLDKMREEAKERERNGQAEDEDEENDAEGEGTQEEAAVEPDVPPKKESRTRRVLRAVAEKFAKARMYLNRCMEHGRLWQKDQKKVILEDLKTKKAREAFGEFLDRGEAICTEGRNLLAAAEDKYAK